jgi:orotidine-5'-phosphate decarboxylase
MTSFGARLQANIAARGPLCVGLDPHATLLAAWGLPDDVAGLAAFTDRVVTAVAGTVAVVKPQIAFYERHGSRGLAVLESALPAIRAAGALALVDAKRGDLDSTMAGYAQAYLGAQAPFAADALTVSPFLGTGSLEPAFAAAAAADAGVFVLARTSNPEGGQVQLARVADGRTVTDVVLDDLRARNAAAGADASQLGPMGAVVGVTADLDQHDLNIAGPLLVPGLGAQGGAPEDLRARFAEVRDLVLPMAARTVLQAGPEVAALRAAAEHLRDACASALT